MNLSPHSEVFKAPTKFLVDNAWRAALFAPGHVVDGHSYTPEQFKLIAARVSQRPPWSRITWVQGGIILSIGNSSPNNNSTHTRVRRKPKIRLGMELNI